MTFKPLTFKGGVHPPHNKHKTEHLALKKAKAPGMVIIPLQQHIGAPCEPLVKVGDEVKLGQKIGEPKGFVGAPVHSSVSGIVKAIEKRPHPGGGLVQSVIIESDGLDTLDESVKPIGRLEDLSADQIKNIMREAGLVGMGGATFPTQVKFSPPPDKKIDTVILNGAECEPYLTSDHRLMVERPEDVVKGIKAMMKAVNVDKGYIAIEENKPDAIKAVAEAAKGEQNIRVVTLKAKYPQGAEKQLIKACTGREVPSGGLPMDSGVIVNNVGTAAALACAIDTGMPLVERIVTVTGSGVKEPQNLIVRIGTPFAEVIEQCGGLEDNVGKIIQGGPMMGIAQYTTEVPVIKGTSGILILKEEDLGLRPELPCIKCAKCVDACPIGLMPTKLEGFAQKGMVKEAEEYNAVDCIECGSCSFVCPAKRPLVERIRLIKADILAERRKAKQA
ncbi:MAG: electron transport complex subunit RsxC [Clostridiales bacterium]|jgi:electron transport complex protein RnfC|nr:electron transport complex subunit RsxC [Clostridiales bacterium]